MSNIRNLVLYCSRRGVCNQVSKSHSCLLVSLEVCFFKNLKILSLPYVKVTNEFVATLNTWSKIIRSLVYEPYRKYINMNRAGCFDSEHLSHKNGIESEGDSPGLLTHVVCRVSSGYLLCAFYLPSTFHGTRHVVACISRYGRRICRNV
jgi:hypothetical protein